MTDAICKTIIDQLVRLDVHARDRALCAMPNASSLSIRVCED